MAPPPLLERGLRFGWLPGCWCLGTHTSLPTPVWLHGDPLAQDHVVGREGGLPALPCCCRSSPFRWAAWRYPNPKLCLLLPPVADSSCRCSWELFRLCCVLAAQGGAGGTNSWWEGSWGSRVLQTDPKVGCRGHIPSYAAFVVCGLLAPGGPLPFALLPVHPPLLSTELVRMVLNG